MTPSARRFSVLALVLIGAAAACGGAAAPVEGSPAVASPPAIAPPGGDDPQATTGDPLSERLVAALAVTGEDAVLVRTLADAHAGAAIAEPHCEVPPPVTVGVLLR